MYAQPSSWARCLIFAWTVHLLSYFMCANSKGSGETAQTRRLALAFAGHLCDKYHNQMSWPSSFVIFKKQNTTATFSSKDPIPFQPIC